MGDMVKSGFPRVYLFARALRRNHHIKALPFGEGIYHLPHHAACLAAVNRHTAAPVPKYTGRPPEVRVFHHEPHGNLDGAGAQQGIKQIPITGMGRSGKHGLGIVNLVTYHGPT